MFGRSAILLCTLAFALFPAHARALDDTELLGKFLFFDKSLSDHPGQACAACHGPAVGWTGPNPGINKAGAVYPGAIHQRFGNRKPPSSAYATLSPVFDYDGDLFVGGNFWDGRATGWELGNPAADQAQGPFLNPVEQNNASETVVCQKVAKSNYASLFEKVYGAGSLDCSPEKVSDTYDNIALAIAAYEDSPEVNQFSSLFDEYLRTCKEGNSEDHCLNANGDQAELDPQGILSDQQWYGFQLFVAPNNNDGFTENEPGIVVEGGHCAACHPAPEFTDHTYDNLGVPRNPENPFYDMDEVLVDGVAINPAGDAWVDPGLAGFLETLPETYFTTWNLDKTDAVEENYGKHKVPTLRNLDLRPGPGVTKAFGHNGFFKSIYDITQFYNTRDSGTMDWPPPEVSANLNTQELGKLGLTEEEVKAIVAFLGTLSDRNEVLPPQTAKAPKGK